MSRIVVPLCVLLVASTPARAYDVRVEFVAVVDLIDDGFCQCISADEMAVGDTLLGYYVYDVHTVDSNPDPRTGWYEHVSGPYGIHVEKGPYVLETDLAYGLFWVAVDDSATDGFVEDKFQLYSYGNTEDPFYDGRFFLISIDFHDYSGAALIDDSLPTGAPDPLKWPDVRRLVVYGTDLVYNIGATIISVVDVTTGTNARALPKTALEQNYPNPFNPRTTIRFTLARPGPVQLAVYDVRGRVVRVLVDDVRAAAPHAIPWDGRDDRGRPVASGIYFYRLVAPDVTASRRMVLVR